MDLHKYTYEHTCTPFVPVINQHSAGIVHGGLYVYEMKIGRADRYKKATDDNRNRQNRERGTRAKGRTERGEE